MESLNKKYYAETMKSRGWEIMEALKYWGREYTWYHRNCNGTTAMKIRLQCMCRGLPNKKEKVKRKAKA